MAMTGNSVTRPGCHDQQKTLDSEGKRAKLYVTGSSTNQLGLPKVCPQGRNQEHRCSQKNVNQG